MIDVTEILSFILVFGEEGFLRTAPPKEKFPTLESLIEAFVLSPRVDCDTTIPKYGEFCFSEGEDSFELVSRT